MLSPATRAGTAEEKQPPGALTANKPAVKHNKSGELQGGAEMHLIGNKQLALGGQGAQAAAGPTMQNACVINLFSPPSYRKPYLTFFGFRKQFLNFLWNKLCLHDV